MNKLNKRVNTTSNKLYFTHPVLANKYENKTRDTHGSKKQSNLH